MKQSNRLVFFGNERLATGLISTDTPTLRTLIDQGYDVAAVVSNYTEGRSRSARRLEIADVAKEYGIPLLLPEHVKDIKDDIKILNAEAAVLVAYGKIIPQGIIDVFPKGIINIHPSLLPKYRGPTPIEQTILDGAVETGVSIMQLTAEMDAGPVYAQERISLSNDENKLELAEKLLDLGAKLLKENLPLILDNELQPKPQNHSEASYTKLLKKEDGYITWDKSAEAIERQVRAFLNFPKSRAELLGQQVIITKAQVIESHSDGGLVVQCKPGYLEILELIAPSGRTISGSEFLRGYAKK